MSEGQNESDNRNVWRNLGLLFVGAVLSAVAVTTVQEPREQAKTATLDIVDISARLQRLEEENNNLRGKVEALGDRVGRDEQQLTNIGTTLEIQHKVFSENIKSIKATQAQYAEYLTSERRYSGLIETLEKVVKGDDE